MPSPYARCDFARRRTDIPLDIRFPKPEHKPTAGPEGASDFFVSGYTALEFFEPILASWCAERCPESRESSFDKDSAMPKVSVNEYGNSLGRKDDVRASREILAVLPVAESERV